VTRLSRYAVVAAVLSTTAATAGCAHSTAGAAAPPPPTARFTDSGVAVTMTLKDWNGQTGVLETTFAPTRPTFHLYSIALPATGVDGVGRPTTITVDGSLATAGPLTTDAPVHQLTPAGSDFSLPVYPDGPVTTTLPVRATGAGRARVAVGYAACSETLGCLFPVSGHAVDVDVSQGAVSLIAG